MHYDDTGGSKVESAAARAARLAFPFMQLQILCVFLSYTNNRVEKEGRRMKKNSQKNSYAV